MAKTVFALTASIGAEQGGVREAALVELSASKNLYRQRHARCILAPPDAGTAATEVPYPIQIWRLGKDFFLVILPGEVGVDFAHRLKKEHEADRVWPAAYAIAAAHYLLKK